LVDRQKAFDLVLKAFSNISGEFPDWRLYLMGPVDESFLELLNGFKSEHPFVPGKISCLGFIERDGLYRRCGEAEIRICRPLWI
jgi:glycosyltransferase involved in cell wall biosynthesis